MLTKKHRSDADRKFGNPAEHFGALDADPAQRLALAAGDIALVLDDTGHILDVSVDEREFPDLVEWAGANWLETVTIESRPKVMEMLAAARLHGDKLVVGATVSEYQNMDVVVNAAVAP